jgi:methylmalonyl-CoA mutase cobalamin-binding domain/chain
MSLDENMRKEIETAFTEQNDTKCAELTKKALDAGADPAIILENEIAMVKKLCENSWWTGGVEKSAKESEKTLLLSDLIMIGDCLKVSAEILKPALMGKIDKATSGGRIVTGTIEGDIHDIGKNIVADIWTSAGYQVEDLGFDVSPKNFVNTVKSGRCDIVAISCSMGMAKTGITKVVTELKKMGLREKIKIIDGGQACYTTDVERLGVDVMGLDQIDGLNKVNELMRVLREERAKKEVKA